MGTLLENKHKVYEILFPDGMVYYGYTSTPFHVRIERHVEASQVGRSKLYQKMRNAEYDCVCRVINTFPTKEEALQWEIKLIRRTPAKYKLNTSWGGEDGENNHRQWHQQKIIRNHYKRKNSKPKYKYK